MSRPSVRGHASHVKQKVYVPFLKERAALVPEGLCFYILKYLDYSKMQNFSAATIDHRQRYLSYFAFWAKEQNVESPKDVSRQFLEEYKKYLYDYKKANGRPLSVASQWTRLEPLRSFFSWMAKKYYLLYNPASELELPKLARTLPRNILTDAQVDAILAQPNLDTLRGLRDRAILELFYCTGMRRLELTALHVYDVNFSRSTVLIREGKGAKDRVVPLGSRAMYWVDRYINQVRPLLLPKEGETKVLFLTNAGDPIRAAYLTWKIRQYIKAAGIEVDGSCHIFRHSMATLMLENGADIRYIQQILGHASLETTEIYTRVSIEKLKEIHAKTHPAERESL